MQETEGTVVFKKLVLSVRVLSMATVTFTPMILYHLLSRVCNCVFTHHRIYARKIIT